MTDFALARRNMIDGQLRPNRVTNAALLAAIGELARERFLPESLRAVAYADEDVPLGGGRYLMEPMVLARLIQTLQPQSDDRALVIGAGRGYGAALLARLVKAVTAVENDAALAAAGGQIAKDIGLGDIQWIVGKLEHGAAAAAPFDVILVEGGVQEIPQTILDQLAEGGRLAVILARPAGVVGVAQLFVKEGGVTSGRPLFEASAALLPSFAPVPKFTF